MSGSGCTSACGWCGACTAPWDEPDVIEDEPEDLEELRLAEQNEDIYLDAVRGWFRRTDPVTK